MITDKRKRNFNKFTPFKSPALNPTNPMQPMILSNHFARTTSRKRPVDKILVNVVKGAIDATQVTTTLLTATFPCTIVGLRWDLSFIVDGGTAPGQYAGCIVIIRDGITASQMALGDGATLYAPEQDVMSYFSGVNQQIDIGSGAHYNGSTKTMRKLMGGDKLVFIAKGQATNTTTIAGTIQFFCKT